MCILVFYISHTRGILVAAWGSIFCILGSSTASNIASNDGNIQPFFNKIKFG